MIRDITKKDRKVFLEMASKFYSSEAVAHNIDSHIYGTMIAAQQLYINMSPFAPGFAGTAKDDTLSIVVL